MLIRMHVRRTCELWRASIGMGEVQPRAWLQAEGIRSRRNRTFENIHRPHVEICIRAIRNCSQIQVEGALLGPASTVRWVPARVNACLAKTIAPYSASKFVDPAARRRAAAT